MGIRTTRTQLAEALHPLMERYGTIFPHGSAIAENQIIDQLASALIADQMAPTLARQVIYAINPEPAFWATEAGRRLYLASGGNPFGDSSGIDHPVADNLLGLTRQAVDWLIPSGKIVRLPGTPIRFTCESLLALFQSRNPEGVGTDAA